MWVDRLDAVKWYIHYYGQFEPLISRAWANFLSAGAVVIDIGGNIGYHALLASKLVGQTGKVITIEPSSIVFKELVQNLKLNNTSNVIAVRKAISNEEGFVTLYYGGENNEGYSSIVRGTGNAEQVEAMPFPQIGEFVPLETIDLIKIDVEGAEDLVVQGMIPILNRLKDDCAIFLEIGPEHGPELLSQFIDSGFKVRTIGNEYGTDFYRNTRPNTLQNYSGDQNKLQDVILCRDEEVFARFERSAI